MPLLVVEISDADLAIVEHVVVEAQAWLAAAMAGKIAACKSRMAAEAMSVLSDDAAVDAMPASTDGLIAALQARPNYKNRAGREAVLVDAKPPPVA